MKYVVRDHDGLLVAMPLDGGDGFALTPGTVLDTVPVPPARARGPGIYRRGTEWFAFLTTPGHDDVGPYGTPVDALGFLSLAGQ